MAGTLLLALGATLAAQERRSRIDVEHYVITAEVNSDSQTLKAEVRVRFTPLDDGTSSLAFELNNALSVSSVTGEGGQPLPAARAIWAPRPGTSSTACTRVEGGIVSSG